MFKSLTVYRMTEVHPDSTFTALVSDTSFIWNLFEQFQCPELDRFDLERRGLVALPSEMVEQATDVVNNRITFLPIIQLIRQRAIDSAAVKCEVARKVKAIEEAERRKVGRREIQGLKDEVLMGLIPQAPIKEKTVSGFVTSNGYILVGATGKAAEDWLSFLREVLGSLSCLPAYGDEADYQVTPAVLELLTRKYLEPDETDFIYEPSGSFMFELHGGERVDIRNCNEATYTDELHGRLRHGIVNWCGFESEDIEFRLTSNFELKSIKLNIQPELSEEDAHLSAAWYRFYLDFFMGTMGRLAAEVRAWAEASGDQEQ